MTTPRSLPEQPPMTVLTNLDQKSIPLASITSIEAIDLDLNPPSVVEEHGHEGSVAVNIEKASISNPRTSYPAQPHERPPHSPSSYYPWLIVSPYTEPSHQLNLTTLDLQNQLLAQTLALLSTATPNYATTPYHKALNWPIVFNKLKHLCSEQNHNWTKTEFYAVEFRSKLKEGIDDDLLFRLDKESHREATASGGSLKYWFGVPDLERRNLATCLWRSREDAVKGGRGPWHKQAREVTATIYESISVRGLKLSVEEDVKDWFFKSWL
ncbi:hypothetical protein LTS08_000263 [Lithohypha guttulata]|nr:hypothetical protein LTS08_000263 [Lithohypha guttulata]